MIWIVNHYLAPDPERGTRRHLALSDELTRSGEEVLLIGCDRHHLKRTSSLGVRLWGRSREGGRDFLWVWSPRYSGNQLARKVNMVCFALLWPFAALSQWTRPRIVIGSSGHIFCVASACLVARLLRAAFVYEIRDLWPLTLVRVGMVRADSRWARVIDWLDRTLLHEADAVVGVMPGVDRYCVDRGQSPEKALYVPNCVDLSSFDSLGSSVECEPLVVCYFGSLGPPNAGHVLVECAELLMRHPPKRPVKIVAIGNGSERGDLERAAEAKGLDNLEFLGPVPRRELRAKVANVAAFVLMLKDWPDIYDYGISPNKLAEYMALGRPVIVVGDPPGSSVREWGCGWNTDYEDPAGLAEMIRKLASLQAGEILKMGERGRSVAAREFDCVTVSRKYASFLRDHEWRDGRGLRRHGGMRS